MSRLMLFLRLCFFGFMFVSGELIAAPPPALQLANHYHESVVLEDYWVSEKLDGVRAYWNGKEFISKQGHSYHAPAWFVADFPAFPLDGELWLARGKFDLLSGIVRKKQPIDSEWQQVSYQVFDLPSHQGDFTTRLAVLRDYFKTSDLPDWLKLIPQYQLDSHQVLQAELDKIESLGGEGLMLHKGSSLYHAGRDDDLLKLKSYEDAEAEVLAYLPGKGKYQGRMGSLKVRALNGLQKGKQFKIGTGFSDALRETPPELGSVITYKYLGFTSTGLPRFASFMRVRKGFIKP